MIVRRFHFMLFAAMLCGVSWAHAAEPISASPKLPKTTPWDLAELSQAPAFTWIDDKGPVRSLLYAGEPYQGKPTRVFAYYATPGTLSGDASKDRDLPAMVLVHGGGGTAFREWARLWAERGYAAIAMDLAGCRPIEDRDPHKKENRERLPDGGPDQNVAEKFDAIDQPPGEQWPYHAVANVLRAHSLVRSFAEVDPSRTGVTGISWGGYLTCITAGVDDRFSAAVPVYGCGFLQHHSAWDKQFAKMSPAQRKRWQTLWDPSRYLPAVSMPILFVNGTNDFAYPLDSYMKSYDAVPGEKQLRVTVKMRHSHPAGWAPAEIGLFIDQHLKQGKPLLEIGPPRVEAGKARASTSGRAKLASAAIHWTIDDRAMNERDWQTAAADVEGATILADAPPAEALAWFFTATDDRGAIVSSRVVLAGDSP
ncbi:MAG: prolyl oligopeptidase family serine peptidase [Pirellulaceae bacterium]